MKIGIDASRAFIPNRTGIEEYAYQTIKGLRKRLSDEEVTLYLRRGQEVTFDLPEKWRVREICWPFLWTQVGLSLEMLARPQDVLFVPAHTVPIFHPKNTIVTIHGLEYEFCPEAYSFWERLYMRTSIKRSCLWARKIISVSQNTKKDLESLYGVPGEKTKVVYEGYENFHSRENENQVGSHKVFTSDSLLRGNGKYILFVGRLEERKNISGIIRAFEILKERYAIPHKLVLAGRPGYGYQNIKSGIKGSKLKKDILEPGFVTEEEKDYLYAGADVFLFPSFYEGFGLPILEAQSFGVPVVTSKVSSMPEVAGNSAFLVDPQKTDEICKAVHRLISEDDFRDDIIEKGYKNLERFSWGKSADSIADIIRRYE